MQDPLPTPFTVAGSPSEANGERAMLLATPFSSKRLADITDATASAAGAVAGFGHAMRKASDAMATLSPHLELEHLRAVVAKRYAPGWLRKLLGWITGLQDHRPIMDELAVMREQGGARFTQLEAAATARLDNLAGKIDRLEASIDVQKERDELKARAANLQRELRSAAADADHWRKLSAADREAMNTHLEQLAADKQASDDAFRAEIAALQSRLAEIAESADILNLTNAFRICAAGGQAGDEFDHTIARLEQLHARLTGQTA